MNVLKTKTGRVKDIVAKTLTCSTKKKVTKSISNFEIRGHKVSLVWRGISYAYDLCSGSSSSAAAAKKRLIMRLLLDSAETATSVCAESMNSFRRRRLLKRRLFKAAPRTCWQAWLWGHVRQRQRRRVGRQMARLLKSPSAVMAFHQSRQDALPISHAWAPT